ncbi:MAG TPA: selenide, water dikinase SelD [Bryobacteraceae bacterium]|nr:selenide, water dikinase SelD [Bryobacteraceae bacterium]
MIAKPAVKLTGQVRAGGCASKLSPAILDRVLSQLPKQKNENVLVGFETADDAGIYKLSDTQALVQTVDFFTPMVDDPYTFGQIAATNALSDVYAMGGIPISSLAILGYPEDGDLDTLAAIMAGGLSKMAEANCAVIGGHSVKDAEMKFGYAVTGLIHPGRVLKNGGAQAGDALFLTKPLGTGVITTALKRGIARPAWIDAAVKSMTTLNKNAAIAISDANLRVNAMTDVTGFGLAGHAREMALASGVALEFSISHIPLLPGAIDCVRARAIPAGLLANRDFAQCVIDEQSRIDPDLLTLFFDPQTAGGLLISIDEKDAAELERITGSTGTAAVRIGTIVPRGGGKPIRLV